MSDKAKAMMCKCGVLAKRIEMLTFSYYYCKDCKIEVGGKAEPVAAPAATPEKWNWTNQSTKQISAAKMQALYPANPSPAVPSALPPGYVALKGESVTCEQCGAEHGTLAQDLPGINTRGHSPHLIDWNSLYVYDDCCDNESESRDDTWFNSVQFHVKHRGWV